MDATKQVLIFDGDCAFCSSSARLLRRITKNKIPIEPYQKLDLESLGLTSELTSKAVYFVSSTKTFVAAAAIGQALIESQPAWALAGRFLKLPVVTFGPDMIAVGAVDQLGGNTHPPAGLAHAALEHITDVQVRCDLANIGRLALVGKGRIAGGDAQRREARQGDDDIFGYAVGKILLLGIAR